MSLHILEGIVICALRGGITNKKKCYLPEIKHFGTPKIFLAPHMFGLATLLHE